MNERTLQSVALVRGVNALVVMIFSSVALQTETNAHTATLVTHTNPLQDTILALHKPKLCWRAARDSHQVRLKFSQLNKGKFNQHRSHVLW